MCTRPRSRRHYQRREWRSWKLGCVLEEITVDEELTCSCLELARTPRLAKSSLEKAKSWIKELQRQADPQIIVALVGNKSDLNERRAVETEVRQSTAAAVASQGLARTGKVADPEPFFRRTRNATPKRRTSCSSRRRPRRARMSLPYLKALVSVTCTFSSYLYLPPAKLITRLIALCHSITAKKLPLEKPKPTRPNASNVNLREQQGGPTDGCAC